MHDLYIPQYLSLYTQDNGHSSNKQKTGENEVQVQLRASSQGRAAVTPTIRGGCAKNNPGPLGALKVVHLSLVYGQLLIVRIACYYYD